jgi:hypothetical protein
MEIEKMSKILSEEIKKFECEQREEDRRNLRKLLREQVNPLLLDSETPVYMIDFKNGTKERIN